MTPEMEQVGPLAVSYAEAAREFMNKGDPKPYPGWTSDFGKAMFEAGADYGELREREESIAIVVAQIVIEQNLADKCVSLELKKFYLDRASLLDTIMRAICARGEEGKYAANASN